MTFTGTNQRACSACRTGQRNSTWHPRTNSRAAERMVEILRRQTLRPWLAALLVILVVNPLPAQNLHGDDMLQPAQVQSGSLLLKMQSGYIAATRIETAIHAEISGLATRVSVSQKFRNTGTEWLEGVYVFPLPEGAAVDRLRMHIGERFIEGEIRESEQAKQDYDAAKAAGKKASLVQQERANLFTASVANIGPDETVTVEIEYLETVHIDAGNFNLRFPVTLTPRYIPGTPLPGRKGSGWSPDTTAVADASRITPPVVTDSTGHRLEFSAEIAAGVPLEIIASRYHPIKVDRHGDNYRISLTDSNTPMDHDLELVWKPVPDSVPRAMLFTETVADKRYALLMMLPPDVESAAPVSQQRELILVIDTSGSMHGTSIDQAKRSLLLALDGLTPRDRFNVIQFNSTTHTLFRETVVASAANIVTAKRYVSSLTANGGTEMYGAIQSALQVRSESAALRQVIFITDGSVGNEEALFSLIEQDLGNARLFTVGIGSAPNSWFMRKAAEAGRGTFTLIGALHEVSEKMGRLFRKIESPQLTDIEIQWPDGVTVDAYPARVADLYRGEPVFVRARMDAAPRANDRVTIRGFSAHGAWDAELPVTSGAEHAGVGALWARARIEDLTDQERRGGDAERIRASITETALAHHLVSKHTSLIAIDKTPTRTANAKLSREQVPNLLPYGQSTTAIFGFPATATASAQQLFKGMLLILIGISAMLLARQREPDEDNRNCAA